MSSCDLIFKLKQETDKLETVIFRLYRFGLMMTLKQSRNITVSNLSVSCFNLNIKT